LPSTSAKAYGAGDLDLLVNNAGIMALPKRTLNSQGLELQIVTNYFGPFLLTALLLPLMKEEQGSRIVTVSSTMARSARLEFDNVFASAIPLPDDIDVPREFTGANERGAA
jgi:NAD(P)-dependent dehydrogenase (short-subunit alcohol dehydrogenase family)